MEVRRISLLEYLRQYLDTFPLPMDFYEKKVAASKGQGFLLVASEGEKPCGLAFACDEGAAFSVYFLFAKEPAASDAVTWALVDECIRCAMSCGAERVECHCADRAPQRVLRRSPSERHPAPVPVSTGSFPALESPIRLSASSERQSLRRALERRGFTEQYRAFHFGVPLTSANVETWTRFMELRGEKLMRYLLRKGFSVLTFDEASSDDMDALYEQIDKHFPAGLDLRTVPDALGGYSSMSMFQGGPVAFCLASRAADRNEITIEQLSSRREFVGKGAFFPPLVNALAKAHENKVDAVTFVIKDANEAMLKMTDSFLSFPDHVETDYAIYLLAL